MDNIINYINKKIIDVRMKNRLSEHIQNIKQEKYILNIKNQIIYKTNNKKLIISKKYNHIKYIYLEKNYKEKYQIFKQKKQYISEFTNKNIKQISIFNENLQEIITNIKIQNANNTYIRTQENNIILIEKLENKDNYYIAINENKYENYIPQNSIFTEIEKEEFINIITKKINEKQILEKYLFIGKEPHLH